MKRLILIVPVLVLFLVWGCRADRISLYFPEEQTFRLVPERRTIEADNLPLAALNALLAGPSMEGLTTLIPMGVKVRSLEVQQGVCYVDLSSEFNTANYGSGPEAAMLGMIVNTLTELSGIEAVYITVEGNIPLCFQHIGSSGPFTWNDSLLKKFGWR